MSSYSTQADEPRFVEKLITDDHDASPMFRRLCNGLYKIIGELNVPGDACDTDNLTPLKMSTYYRLMGENFDSLFVETAPESLSYVYQMLGCYHSLLPTDMSSHKPPSVPALLTSGFLRWQVVQILLCPQIHAKCLQRAVEKFCIIDPVTGKPFPRSLPDEVLPSEPDLKMTLWHQGQLQKMEEDMMKEARHFNSSSTPFSEPPPRATPAENGHDAFHGYPRAGEGPNQPSKQGHENGNFEKNRRSRGTSTRPQDKTGRGHYYSCYNAGTAYSTPKYSSCWYTADASDGGYDSGDSSDDDFEPPRQSAPSNAWRSQHQSFKPMRPNVNMPKPARPSARPTSYYVGPDTPPYDADEADNVRDFYPCDGESFFDAPYRRPSAYTPYRPPTPANLGSRVYTQTPPSSASSTPYSSYEDVRPREYRRGKSSSQSSSSTSTSQSQSQQKRFSFRGYYTQTAESAKETITRSAERIRRTRNGSPHPNLRKMMVDDEKKKPVASDVPPVHPRQSSSQSSKGKSPSKSKGPEWTARVRRSFFTNGK
ncbi:UTP-glucose-1-phosphate uridylyltransferase [Ascosphaera pollenicola]|nr:UTP-glucose-1-phosphate uridylyltransferase [Ascosphaera pollenicola]